MERLRHCPRTRPFRVVALAACCVPVTGRRGIVANVRRSRAVRRVGYLRVCAMKFGGFRFFGVSFVTVETKREPQNYYLAPRDGRFIV